MALFALAGLGGAAVGLVRGGRPRRLLALRLRWTPLVWACLAAQVLLGATGDGPHPLVRDLALVASYAGTGVWLAANVGAHRGGMRAGFAVVLAGWLLNVVPMALNDGMPVSTAAQEAIGAGDDPRRIVVVTATGRCTLEDAFVTVGADYARRRRISSEAWEAVGVPPAVLVAARISAPPDPTTG